MEAHLDLDPSCGILRLEIRRAMAGDHASRGARLDRILGLDREEERGPSPPRRDSHPQPTHEAASTIKSVAHPSTVTFTLRHPRDVPVRESTPPAARRSGTKPGQTNGQAVHALTPSKKVHVLRQLTRSSGALEEMEAAAVAALEGAQAHSRPRVLTARSNREKVLSTDRRASGATATKRVVGVASQPPTDADTYQMQAAWNRQQQSVLSPGGVKGIPKTQTCTRNGRRGTNNRSFLERYNLDHLTLFEPGRRRPELANLNHTRMNNKHSLR